MKQLKTILTILFSILFLTNCTEDEIDFYGSIRGTVKDGILLEPISGVSISLSPSGKTMTTGTDGIFEFTNLESGKYTVAVSKDKYGSDSKSITVLPGEVSQADFSVQTANGSLVLSIPILDFGKHDIDLGFDIKNIGKNDMTYKIENSFDWLTISPATGVISSTRIEPIIVSLNRALIDENKTVRIPISSNAGSADIEIKVEFNTLKAKMILSKTTLDFGQSMTKMSFDITNEGKSDLEFAFAELGDWITFLPDTATIIPGGFTTVIATIDRSKITQAINQNLTITSNVGSLELPVIVQETIEAGVLEVSETFLDFGEKLLEQTFVISNTGTAPFNYTLKATNTQWLKATNPSETVLEGESITVTLIADRSLVFGDVSETLTVSTDVGEKNITLNIYEPINYGTVESCDKSIDISVIKTEMSGNDLYIDIKLTNNGDAIQQFRFGTSNLTANTTVAHAIDSEGNTYYLGKLNKKMTVEFNGVIANTDRFSSMPLMGGGASLNGQIVITDVNASATLMKSVVVATYAYNAYIDFDKDSFTLSNIPIIR